jgi:hypothetical protein
MNCFKLLILFVLLSSSSLIARDGEPTAIRTDVGTTHLNLYDDLGENK